LRINLIPDLPTTTYDEALESLEKLKLLAPAIDGIAIFPFEATRSSQIGRAPERYGLKVAYEDGDSGQAAFAENHLTIVDGAMTDVQRQEINALYREFAESINSGAAKQATFAFSLEKDDPAQIHVAEADFDLVHLNSNIQIFNWKTRRRWQAHAGFNRLIDRLREVGPCSRQKLIAGCSNTEAMSRLVDELMTNGIFVAS
jgi:hypothetical protein